MKDKYIVIFTKTNWNEEPRIRHQVTKLLIENKHKVLFFQKTSHTNFSKSVKRESKDLFLINYYEPLHHQLKLNNLFTCLNDLIVKRNIKKILKNYEIEFVVNFNYDYTFLNHILPNKKIITIINDDFVAQAKEYRKRYAKYLLKETCQKSDKVLAVSYSLVDNLKEYNKNTELFLPWAESKYIKPIENLNRDIILFYGYINYRIDWVTIEKMLENNLKVRFIGPIDKKVVNLIDTLNKKYTNFEYAGTCIFDKLYTDDVLCSIIPYKKELEAVQAITINNKSFNLLSKGLPLVYPDLPNLIFNSSKIISIYQNQKDIMSIVKFYEKNFDRIQQEIKSFLSLNYKESRYDFFK